LGLIVAKRIYRLAKDRSLVKRVIRESFRHYQLPVQGHGFDIVVQMKSPTIHKDSRELRKNLDLAWLSIRE
jgi:ribonuclease P protein component